MTSAAGLAMGGMHPVVAIYSTFLQRAYDQIIHDVALQKLPVVFAVDRGGVVGEDGPTHHGVFDLAYLRPIPGFTLMAPKDEAELVRWLHQAADSRTPVVLNPAAFTHYSYALRDGRRVGRVGQVRGLGALDHAYELGRHLVAPRILGG